MLDLDFGKIEFRDEHLSYVDAPILGFVRSHAGALFAFRCFVIVPDKLWHWIFIPVESTALPPDHIFETAAKSPPDEWISVVEDARGSERRHLQETLTGGAKLFP